MTHKSLLGYALAGLALLALLTAGCSEDTKRVITSPTASYSPTTLATDVDWPDAGTTSDEYYFDGFSDSDDEPVDNPVLPHEDEDEDDPSHKPIDNGKQ